MLKRIHAVTFGAFVVAALVTLPASSQAQAEHANGGLGFHSTAAPVGLRWWTAGQKIGVDLGLGFTAESAADDDYPDEKLNSWAVDVGVPFVLKSWDRVHFMFRPGLLYQSQQVTATTFPAPFDTEDRTTFTVSGELEAEVFLADNVSVSASHGVGFTSINPPGSGDNITSFRTIGNNFTEVGFHIYVFGGGAH